MATLEFGRDGLGRAMRLGLLAPRQTPPGIIRTVNTAIAQSLDAPKVRQVLMSAGAESAAGSPDALARFLQAEMAKWAKVVKAVGITSSGCATTLMRLSSINDMPRAVQEIMPGGAADSVLTCHKSRMRGQLPIAPRVMP